MSTDPPCVYTGEPHVWRGHPACDCQDGPSLDVADVLQEADLRRQLEQARGIACQLEGENAELQWRIEDAQTMVNLAEIRLVDSSPGAVGWLNDIRRALTVDPARCTCTIPIGVAVTNPDPDCPTHGTVARPDRGSPEYTEEVRAEASAAIDADQGPPGITVIETRPERPSILPRDVAEDWASAEDSVYDDPRPEPPTPDADR